MAHFVSSHQGSQGASAKDGGKKTIPPASLLDNYPDTTINPYELMGLERDATEDDVKRAYKKGALRWHPDKHPAEQKIKAQKAFQRLTKAYAVLSDPVRRQHYDATGRIEDALHMDPDDPWRWQPFYQHCWAKMSQGDVEAFAKEYRFSEEERQDLLKQYTVHKGDMNKIYEHVTLSNPLEDDKRYRKWINEAIEKGEVKSYDTFTKEAPRMIKARNDRARKEAREAEKLEAALKRQGKWFDAPSEQENTDLLALAIQEKNKSRSVALLDHLMDKYVTKPSKKGGKKGSDAAEPSEEAFEKNRKKGFQEALERDKLREEKKVKERLRKRRAAEAQLDAEELDDDDEDLAEKLDRHRQMVAQDMADDEEARKGQPPADGLNPRKRKKLDELWGKPAEEKQKKKTPAKGTAKKAAAKAKAPANKKTAKARPSRRAVVESEDEDSTIELGSEDSDENDENEE